MGNSRVSIFRRPRRGCNPSLPLCNIGQIGRRLEERQGAGELKVPGTFSWEQDGIRCVSHFAAFVSAARGMRTIGKLRGLRLPLPPDPGRAARKSPSPPISCQATNAIDPGRRPFRQRLTPAAQPNWLTVLVQLVSRGRHDHDSRTDGRPSTAGWKSARAGCPRHARARCPRHGSAWAGAIGWPAGGRGGRLVGRVGLLCHRCRRRGRWRRARGRDARSPRGAG